MASIINGIFDFLAVAFDKIPLINKLKNYRAVIGYIGLGVTTFLLVKGIISNDLAIPLLAGFEAFKDLALNSKGRE